VTAARAARPERPDSEPSFQPGEGRILTDRPSPHSRAAVVRLRDAEVTYGERVIWRNADLEVAPGEFVVVLGPNGAGKSTLLRVLLGLRALAHGSVEVLGGPPRRGRQSIGYVPQRRALDPDLTVRARDLVALGVDGNRWGVALSGATRRRRSGLVDAALEAVGATAYADRPVGRLSGGEQQRLLLAQALVTEPRILLLDEPLASLDLRSQGVVSALVARLARERDITVILVAHDVNPLIPFVDRVVYLASGGMVSGRADQVITTETLTALYDHPVEVLRDSRGRVVVVGLDDCDSHHD
jgi:zinc/manganese transport system ATP-binding protein